MTLFEAGILAKMTTDEYKNLPEQSRRSNPVTESDNKESKENTENNQNAPVMNFQCIFLAAPHYIPRTARRRRVLPRHQSEEIKI